MESFDEVSKIFKETQDRDEAIRKIEDILGKNKLKQGYIQKRFYFSLSFDYCNPNNINGVSAEIEGIEQVLDIIKNPSKFY